MQQQNVIDTAGGINTRFNYEGANEVNINKSYQQYERDAQRNELHFEDWGKAIGTLAIAGTKLYTEVQSQYIKDNMLSETALGRAEARQLRTGLEGRTGTYKMSATEDANSDVINNKDLSLAYKKAYLSYNDSMYSSYYSQDRKEYNDSVGNLIKDGGASNFDTEYGVSGEVLVDSYKIAYPSLDRSTIRDNVYDGFSQSFAGRYTNTTTYDELKELDIDYKKAKEELKTPNFRLSNSKDTKFMIAKGDAQVKSAKTEALKRIQEEYKVEQVQVDSQADVSTNIDISPYDGTITIKPNLLAITPKEHYNLSIKAGKSKAVALTASMEYQNNLEIQGRVYNEITDYSDFEKLIPDDILTTDAKKYLDYSFQVSSRTKFTEGDYTGLHTQIKATGKTINIAPTLYQGFMSDNNEIAINSYKKWSHLVSTKQGKELLHSIISTKDISKFTTMASLKVAGYSNEQIQDLQITLDSTPKEYTGGVSKDVSERLDNKLEGLTVEQASTVKAMATALSAGNVNDSIIEDYIDSITDTYKVKEDTTLLMGGYTVLRGTGSTLPDITSNQKIAAELKLIELSLVGTDLEKSDVSIYYQPNTQGKAVVVMKSDTNIVISKKITDIGKLSRELILKEAERTKQDPKAQDKIKEGFKNVAVKSANFIVESVSDAVDDVKTSHKLYKENISGPIKKGLEAIGDAVTPTRSTPTKRDTSDSVLNSSNYEKALKNLKK